MAEDHRSESSGTLFTSRRGRRGSGMPPVWWLVILVVLAAGIWAGWRWFRSDEGRELMPAEPVAAPVDSVVPREPFVLPSLDVSDEAVRTLVSGVAEHPKLASWLVTDDLVRRFVEGVVDISRGSSPLPALEPLIPPEAFTVRHSGDRILVDSRSYARYDLLAEVFASMEARQAADVYREILPLIREAYRELGIPDQTWEEVLAQAIHNLLAVEVPEAPLEVREAIGRYVYAEPSVESLTPAAKHLLRMGPVNARIIQNKVREISEELTLPEPE